MVIPTRVADVGAGFPKVPLLLGTNANEGTLFTTAVFNGVPVANDTEYVAALTRAFGASATDVAETGHKKAKCDFWDTLYK